MYVDDGEMVADLVWRHSLAHRIHCMWYGDLIHDGLSELTIVTTGGVHILQVSLSFSTTELRHFFMLFSVSFSVQHNLGQARRVVSERLVHSLGRKDCELNDEEGTTCA